MLVGTSRTALSAGRQVCANGVGFSALGTTSAASCAPLERVAGFFRNEADALQAGPLAVVIVPAPESKQRLRGAKLASVRSIRP